MNGFKQLAALIVVLTVASHATADTTALSFVGRMTEADGRPVVGPVKVEVRFFRSIGSDDEVSVDPLVFDSVDLDDGVFNLPLALTDAKLHIVFANTSTAVFIQVKDVTHQRVYPRQALSPVPYALKVPVDGKTIGYDSDGLLTVSPSSAPVAGEFLTKDGSGNFIWQAPLNPNFLNSQTVGTEATFVSALGPTDAGRIWYNQSTGQIKYWTGSAQVTLGVAGSGLTSFNGQLGNSQLLSVGTTGLAPAWSSGSNTHTLNIPLASAAGVTAGVVSKVQFDSFAAKAASGANSDITSLTGLANDSISGNKIDGGVISNFASSGIDDNAAGTAITITGAGNVGINTPSPNFVGVNATSRVLTISGDSGGNYFRGVLELRNPDAGMAANGDIYFVGGNTQATAALAIIGSGSEGAGGASGFGSHLRFSTKADNGASAERVRISSSGNVGIGTTSPGFPLDVNGAARVSGPLNLKYTSADAGTNGLIINSNGTLGGIVPAQDYSIVVGGTITNSGNSGYSLNIGGTDFGGGNSYFNTILGYGASTTVDNNGMVAIGYASVTGGQGIAIGRSATSAAFGSAFGYSSAAGSSSIAIGTGSKATGSSSAAFGTQATITDNDSYVYGVATGANASSHGFGVNSSLSARMHIRGIGATSATKALLIENSTPTGLLTVLNDGNVGIGTTAPFSGAGFRAGLEIASAANTKTPTLMLRSSDATSNNAQVLFAGPSGLNWIAGTDMAAGNGGRDFSFMNPVSGTASLVLQYGTGNIGIGSVAPGYTLDVNGTVRASNFISTSGTSNWGASTLTNVSGVSIGTTSTGADLLFGAGTNRSISVQSQATAGSGLTIQAGGTSGANLSGGDLVLASGTANGTGSSRIDFKTASGGAPATSMTILGNGNMGIGTTSPVNRLDVAGAATIGAGYAGAQSAPTNGFLVEGDVRVGTADGFGISLSGSGTSQIVNFSGNSSASYIQFNGTTMLSFADASATVLNRALDTRGNSIRGFEGNSSAWNNCARVVPYHST